MKHPKAEMLPIGEPVVQVEDTIMIEMGSAETLDTDTDRPVCVLWVPDCEQRHGWREYYVKKQGPKPGARKMGYKP